MNALCLSVVLTALSGAVPPDLIPPQEEQGDALPAGAIARLGTWCFPPAPKEYPLALAPNGKLLAVMSYRNIILLKAPTSYVVRRIPAAVASPAFLSFSPDSKTLALLDSGNVVHLWDLATGKERGQLRYPLLQHNDDPLAALSFSANGKYLAGISKAARWPGYAVVWKIASGQRIVYVEMVHNRNVGAALSPDGKLLATCGQAAGPDFVAKRGKMIYLWDVKTSQLVRKLKTQGVSFHTGAAFSPDGKTLAAIADQSTIIIWDVAKGKELRHFACSRSAKPLIQFSRDGKVLAVATEEGVIQLWNTATWKRTSSSEVPDRRILGLGFPARGKALAFGKEDGEICLWDAASGERLAPSGSHRTAITGIVFTADGKSVLTADIQGQVCRWNRATNKEAAHYLLKNAGPQALSPRWHRQVVLSPDGRYAAADVGLSEDRVLLWKLSTGAIIRDYKGPKDWIAGSLAFSADGRFLGALSDYDKTLFVWDTAGVKLIRRLKTEPGRIWDPGFGYLAFSPHGRLAAASFPQNGNKHRRLEQVRCWRVDTGKEVFTAKNEPGPVAFSSDGKLIAAAGGQVVVVYDTARGTERRRLQGVKNISYLAFSPDSRTLAGAWTTPDWTRGGVVVWELATGGRRLLGAGHQGGVYSLAYSGDGCVLASGSTDATILLWDMTGRSLSTGRSPPKADALWSELNDRDVEVAFKAMGQLTANPALAMHLFRDRLKEDDELRGVRAVEVLEHLGTPEARQLLKTLAGGRPGATLTRAAGAALARLRAGG
jgi:WD40 repeat protein